MNKKTAILAASMLGFGAIASVGIQAFAQTPTTTAATPVVQASTTAKDTPSSHHAPMGGDGVVASINGTTVVMSEEADEGGTSYTVDASKVTNLGTIKVGDKVFVQGTTNGTNVVATSISLKHGGDKNEAPDAKDANGNDTETNDGN